MRQLNVVARYVLVVAVVMMLTVPVQARSQNEERVWSGPNRAQIARIVKIVKKMKEVVRALGDGLSDPRP